MRLPCFILYICCENTYFFVPLLNNCYTVMKRILTVCIISVFILCSTDVFACTGLQEPENGQFKRTQYGMPVSPDFRDMMRIITVLS